MNSPAKNKIKFEPDQVSRAHCRFISNLEDRET